MLRCACGRRLIIDRSADRLILRCPKHGIVLRYYAHLSSTTSTAPCPSPPAAPDAGTDELPARSGGQAHAGAQPASPQG